MKVFAVFWISLLTLTAAWAGEDPGRQVLVVYNESVAESKPLAEYYAQRRGVPTGQMCAIRVRDAETITRKEFDEQVRGPIVRFMVDHGLLYQLSSARGVPVTFDNKITYVALMYGVPQRIEDDPHHVDPGMNANAPAPQRRNEAAVDSELTWLPSSGVPLNFAVLNPFFNKSPAVFNEALRKKMVLVSRLDGPDPATVRRMIDDSLAVERTGLLGKCYVDAGGQLEEGEKWIRHTGQIFREQGFETVMDEKPTLFPEDFQMTDAAMYAGWYSERVTGVFKRPDFKFRRGAVAYHLHSWSAAHLHNVEATWVGPLLAHGAAASFGNVFEPYLRMTPHVDMFFQRLLAGATFAEAGWYSQPTLSWQTTFVGDPLYRPFGLSVDGQIAQLEADKNPDVAWAYLRKVNLLLNIGNTTAAEQLCAEKVAALRSPVLMEKLGVLKLKKN